MQKERPPYREIDLEVVRGFAVSFIPRRDMYPMQLADGRYISVKKSLSLAHIESHLQGIHTLGAYALSPDSLAQWICLDADDDRGWHQLENMASRLMTDNLSPYLEPSRRGGHLWLFTPRISGLVARGFAYQLMREHEVDEQEVFPKQTQLRTGPGSFVRLPLGVHRKTGKRYHFVDLEGNPLAPTIRDQIARLARPTRVPQGYIDDVLSRIPPRNKSSNIQMTGPRTIDLNRPVSEQIKRAIQVVDYVGNYVDLDDHHRGCCPFHDDHHKSFSVNVDENYWFCFACEIGGSVIDFAMHLREQQGQDGSFKATLRELAGKLL